MFVIDKLGGEITTVDAIGKILRDAADYIERHGWCQGALNNGERVCALGAVLMVTDEGIRSVNCQTPHVAPWFTPNSPIRKAYLRLMNHLKQLPDAWNDNPCRTAEQVVTALRAAATAEDPPCS